MNNPTQIFDRKTLRRRRDRAASGIGEFDFLQRQVAEMIADCLLDVRRVFPVALDLGCRTGQMAGTLPERAGIETLVQSDLSESMAFEAGGLAVAADEEALPFAEQSFDLVTSCLALHWVNDLPGTLIQIRRCLKPDGLFLGALLGGATLSGYRKAIETGATSESIDVSYPSPSALLADLRGMGETNAVQNRRRTFLRKSTLTRALELYQERYDEGGGDGRVGTTFEVLFLTGWAPGPGQPQALTPGSGTMPLAEAFRDQGTDLSEGGD